MAILGGVACLMPSGEDVGQFRRGHLPSWQHMGNGRERVVEREHGPGFAVGHLLLDQTIVNADSILTHFPADLPRIGNPTAPW
jgi:hypothetical protein